MAALLAVVHRRVVRLLERRGLLSDEPDPDETDDLFERSPALAGCYSASIGHTSALSDRAGQRVRRLGTLRHPPANDIPLGPRRARFDGFDLHADVAVPARDRARLERLCRYTARPSVSNERLERLPDGTIVLHLKAPWSDGTEQILLEPLELLERLAALVPRPRTNLVLYHGVLAPNAKWRSRAVRHGRESLAPDRPEPAPAPAPSPTPTVVTPFTRRRRHRWADLMRRAFGIDVLECPRCGGKLVLLACITQPRVIRAILRALGLPDTVPAMAPARAPPDEESTFDLGA